MKFHLLPSQLGLLATGFLILLGAIPNHHDHGVARAGLTNPWPAKVYNTPMSVYLGYVVQEAEQDLADYADCRQNLRHPDTSPLADHWECERLYFPDRKVIHELKEVRAILEIQLEPFRASADTDATRKHGKGDMIVERSGIIEELAIYDNMDSLVSVSSRLRKQRSWTTDAEIFPLIADIRDLWSRCCHKERGETRHGDHMADHTKPAAETRTSIRPRMKAEQMYSYLDFQQLKYVDVYNATGMELITQRGERVARDLDDLVTAFRAQAPVWPTLPAAMDFCPSPDLPLLKARRIANMFSQSSPLDAETQMYVIDESYGDVASGDQHDDQDGLWRSGSRPVIFRHVAKPLAREPYPCLTYLYIDPHFDLFGQWARHDYVVGRATETTPAVPL
ncbi:hypothetical protein Micbo1qcDRAFT_161961, partial [Microdochium bolleyi]